MPVSERRSRKMLTVAEILEDLGGLTAPSPGAPGKNGVLRGPVRNASSCPTANCASALPNMNAGLNLLEDMPPDGRDQLRRSFL